MEVVLHHLWPCKSIVFLTEEIRTVLIYQILAWFHDTSIKYIEVSGNQTKQAVESDNLRTCERFTVHVRNIMRMRITHNIKYNNTFTWNLEASVEKVQL